MNILYVPGCYYLSNPIFLAIAKKASEKNHNCIYFDTNDPSFSISNSVNNDANAIANTFDRVICDTHSFTATKFSDIKNLFDAQQYKRKLHKNLEHLNPDVIIVCTDMGGNIIRMINNWAEKNNVPFVVMQPAFLEGQKRNVKNVMRNKLSYQLFNKILDIPLFRRQTMFGCEKSSNYLFLWGKDFKERYKGTCIEKNIRLVGNPVFDNIKSKILDMRDVSPTALLCPSMFSGVISKENEAKIQKMYQDIIKQNPHVHFIVKVHPRETTRQYVELFKDCGDNSFITKTANLYDLFRVVDVQISLASYSSFEAIVAGVPVILLGVHMLKSPFDHFNHKAIWKPRNMLQFNAVLNVCLSKKYIRQFRKLRINYLSTKLKYLGNSAERVINELEMIVE